MTNSALAPVQVDVDWVANISESVRVAVGMLGLTQVEISRLIGTSQRAISNKLRGVTPWDLREVQKFAALFGIPQEDLFAGTEAWLPHLRALSTTGTNPESFG
ncbi:helix-turn-helix transcriptional regulator [Streptomyces sp. NPDC050095]|uniref:helix-turn-helix transcriptional regulator n=1 Tax=unclassified Streptomyces TaxID=2593676 RepID=UPI003437F378